MTGIRRLFTVILALLPFSTAAAGEIQLRTGEYQAEAYDLWEGSRKGGRSRVYCSTHAGGVFGPGWKSDLDGRLVPPVKPGEPLIWENASCGEPMRFVPVRTSPGKYVGDLSDANVVIPDPTAQGQMLTLLGGMRIFFDREGRRSRWRVPGDPWFEIVRNAQGLPQEVRFAGEVMTRIVTGVVAGQPRVLRLEAAKAAGPGAQGKAAVFEYDGGGRLVRAVSAIGREHRYAYDSSHRLISVHEEGPGGDAVDETIEYAAPAGTTAGQVRVHADRQGGRTGTFSYAPPVGDTWSTTLSLKSRNGAPLTQARFEWKTARKPGGTLFALAARNSVGRHEVEAAYKPGRTLPVWTRVGDHKRAIAEHASDADAAWLPPWLLPTWYRPEWIAARLWADAVARIELVDAEGRVKTFGSGFFVAPDGVLITNYHVMASVAEGQPLRPRFILADGRIIDRYQVGQCRKSARTDVCVLKLDHYPNRHFDLKRALAESADGTEVFSLGNAEGRMMPALRGYFRGRYAFRNAGYVEVTNEILPGDSGGPIFTWDGRLVGMSTVILFSRASLQRPRSPGAGGAPKQFLRSDTRIALSASEIGRADDGSAKFVSPREAFGPGK